MKFSYKVQSKTGEIKTGVMEASDRFALARMFREAGDHPIMIEESKKKTDDVLEMLGLSKYFEGKVKMQEKIAFTKNLAGMLLAGLPLSRALEVLKKQTTKKGFQEIIEDFMRTIDKGGTLSEGMAKYPKVFSTLFVSMVKAGEESGKMSNALLEIGTNLEKSYALRRKVKGAMMYPAIIISAMILIAILMLIYVVPTLTATFKDLNIDLPFSTHMIIFVSDAFSSHPFLVFVILGLLVVGVRFILKVKKLAPFFDALILKLPAIGTISKEVNSARTARTLSTLLSSSVDVTRALTITREVIQNVHYRKVIEKAIDGVQKGIPISTAFRENTHLYPVMVGEMMEVGEETGKFTAMLTDIAVFYEGEVEAKTKDLSTIIEPVLMVIVGAGVGFFAISIISPLYSIGGAI